MRCIVSIMSGQNHKQWYLPGYWRMRGNAIGMFDANPKETFNNEPILTRLNVG